MTRWHRIRFYEGRWSSFDSVEPCGHPHPCSGCTYNLPFCEERGRVIRDDPPAPEAET